MNKIFSAIKCVQCKSLLHSPIILPCGHSVCRKHQLECKQLLYCGQCHREFDVHACELPPNQALALIIEAEIDALEFGRVHREARKSCDLLGDVLKQVDDLLKDPTYFTNQNIGDLKNAVQLKGEEIKLRVDEEMNRLIAKLDRYERDCKYLLSTNEYVIKAEKVENALKTCQNELENWTNVLNKIKFDEPNWNSIKKECDFQINAITDQIEVFKKDLLLNKLDVVNVEIEHFKRINVDPVFEYAMIQLDSKIIEKNHRTLMSDLLEVPITSKWTLLYRGSSHGFGSKDFHAKCDGKKPTLTIVKATSGNIFGGYTEKEWMGKEGVAESHHEDKNAFIFSLINQNKKPLKIKVNKGDEKAICCSYTLGPTFGSGPDLCIVDKSNGAKNHSKLGTSYVHPDNVNDSDSFLAGSSEFQVDEIEVFQLLL